MNDGLTRKQLAAFIRLQLVNLYGINVYRHIKDPKEKRKKLFLGAAYLLVIIMVMYYAGAMSLGYVYIGLAELLPAYLIMLVSLIILMFSIFKAGDIIFQKNAHDILSALPVKNSVIIFSRFIRLYTENLLLTIAVMLPAAAVYGILQKPLWSFYVVGVFAVIFIPFLPITVSVFVGTLIKAIASRAKHKNLISTLLSIALVTGILIVGMRMSAVEEELDIEALKNLLSTVMDLIYRIYPPAVWLGNAMLTGNFAVCLGCMCGSFIIFLIVLRVISVNYAWIHEGIFGTSAKHDYQMKTLKSSYMLGALYKRELKRYFASSVYVTNTIVGPIMGMMFAGAMLFVKPEQLEAAAAQFYAQSGLMLQIRSMFPMILAAMFMVMPITAVSISMEGRQWWIIKTLPIRTKDLLNGKLLMNLTVVGPFYIISVLLISIGQKVSPAEFLWICLLPLSAILFSGVFGQTVNLKLAVFDWENEVAVVKQSAAAFVGGIVPLFIMAAATLGVMLVPAEYMNSIMMILCLCFGTVAFLLHRKNGRIDLMKI